MYPLDFKPNLPSGNINLPTPDQINTAEQWIKLVGTAGDMVLPQCNQSESCVSYICDSGWADLALLVQVYWTIVPSICVTSITLGIDSSFPHESEAHLAVPQDVGPLPADAHLPPLVESLPSASKLLPRQEAAAS